MANLDWKEDIELIKNKLENVGVDLQTATKVSGTTDPSGSFSNGDAPNTQKTITIPKPTNISKIHRFVFDNPGASDITVKVYNKKGIGGSDKHYLGSFIIPAMSTITGTSIRTDARNKLEGCFLDDSDLELIISNNQAIGGSGAFTFTVQIYGL